MIRPISIAGNSSRRDRILQSSFWLLSATTLLNINGVALMALGVDRVVSVVVLGLCLIIVLRTGLSSYVLMGRSARLFAVFLGIYMCLGTVAGLAKAPEETASYCLKYLFTPIIVTASATGSMAIARSYGTSTVLSRMLALNVVASSGVFLSPFFGSQMHAYMESTMRAMTIDHRYSGFFGNPNEAGLATCVSVALAFSLIRESRFGNRRTLLVILLLHAAVAILMTFSRTAMLTFVMLAAFHLLYFFRRGAHGIVYLVGSTALVTLAIWFFTGGWQLYDGWSSTQQSRIRSVGNILTGRAKGGEDSGRLKGLKGGIAYWCEDPMFGHGIGSMHAMPRRIFDGEGVHNTFIMVLGETGIVGILAFLVFYYSFWQGAYQCQDALARSFVIGYLIVFTMAAMAGHTVLLQRNHNFVLGTCFGLLGASRYRQLVRYHA